MTTNLPIKEVLERMEGKRSLTVSIASIRLKSKLFKIKNPVPVAFARRFRYFNKLTTQKPLSRPFFLPLSLNRPWWLEEMVATITRKPLKSSLPWQRQTTFPNSSLERMEFSPHLVRQYSRRLVLIRSTCT